MPNDEDSSSEKVVSLPERAAEVRAADVLQVLRRSPSEAGRLLNRLPIPHQVRVLIETPINRRARILDLITSLEQAVPIIPELEMCTTMKILDGAPVEILARFASPEQMTACIDLDGWEQDLPHSESLRDWIEKFASGGEMAFLRCLLAIDSELLSLLLRERLVFFQSPGDDDWEPPAGTMTIDGQAFYQATDPQQDITLEQKILDLLFRADPTRYLSLIQEVMAGFAASEQEFARRWRRGRLTDLGYPDLEDAVQIYQHIPEDELDELPGDDADTPPAPPSDRPAPLPDRGALGYPIFAVLQDLTDEEREQAIMQFMELSNMVLVADHLPLADPDSVRHALDRAARIASRGLLALADGNEMEPISVLRRTGVRYLFQVGANIDDEEPPRAEVEEDETDGTKTE